MKTITTKIQNSAKGGQYVSIVNEDGYGASGTPYKIIDQDAIADIVKNFESVLRMALQMPVLLDPNVTYASAVDYATRDFNGD